MSLLKRQGYSDCIYEYLKYNLNHCEEMVIHMSKNEFNPDYLEGYILALIDIKHKFILIGTEDKSCD